MKKSLIALAVAGAFAAPAFAATSNVDVYGVINVAIEDTDADNIDMSVLDNTSRIGFKGTEDLGGGLKAIWQVESALGGNGATMGTPTTTNGLASRNTFVGLSGGFGTVLAGRHDTPYKLGTASLDIFGDTIADYNLGRTGVELLDNEHDYRSPQAIAYISPTWSGFHFAVAAVASNTSPTIVGVNVSTTIATSATNFGSISGLGTLNSGDTFDATSATAVYSNGPLFLSLSYQKVEAIDSDTMKVAAAYTFGDTTVGALMEKCDNCLNARAGGALFVQDISDRDSWLVNVKHNMGPIVLKAQYGQVDIDASNQNQDMWALGVDYNLSKRTTAYFAYASGDADTASTTDDDTVAGWNIGMKHSF